jgi:hypothetical protein
MLGLCYSETTVESLIMVLGGFPEASRGIISGYFTSSVQIKAAVVYTVAKSSSGGFRDCKVRGIPFLEYIGTFINLLRARQVLTISEGGSINSPRARSYLVAFLGRLSWMKRTQTGNG